MNFYINFFTFNVIIMCVYTKTLVLRSDFIKPEASAIGLQFFVIVNNSLGEECVVEANPDECCLDGDKKCDVVEIIGSDTKEISPGETKTLALVAPLLDPYERKGHCTIYIDTRPVSRPKNVNRETVKIEFDTSLKKHGNCKHLDEDPFNNCMPVNCETYYNGKRSFYHPLRKRCVSIPNCSDEDDRKLATVTYNPVSNKCIKRPAIDENDINLIKSLTHNNHRIAKDLTIITLKHPKTHPEKVQLDNSAMILTKTDIKNTTNQKPLSYLNKKTHNNALITTKKRNRFQCMLEYLSTNKYTLVCLTILVIVQCCFICSLIYCSIKSCYCCHDKKVVTKLFHQTHRDATDTTPLICPSNVDTQMLDFEYLSESSNYIDKRIKCYKSCQKERKNNNVKLSMSDDILSKCLTRRDWNRLPRSETIPEVSNEEMKVPVSDKPIYNKKPNVKVNFEEVHKVKKPNSTVKTNQTETNISSERELRCHDYDRESSILAAFKNSRSNRYFKRFKFDNNSHAPSIDREAQAYFSNDSVDDFLSERRMMFIADNVSKYSLTSGSSVEKCSGTSQSTNTSKHNPVRNILSMLSSRSRGQSDPGLNKPKEAVDIELLHVSRAVAGSSSNETDCSQEFKRIKESTSSI